MSGLDMTLRRGARLAEVRAERRRREIVRRAEALGLAARIEEETILLEGRGLLERWLRDAGLRDIGRTEA